MGRWITPEDLAPFADIDSAKAREMIADAEAWAVVLAPCIESIVDDGKAQAVRAILRQCILRWHDSGSGAVTTHSETAGIFARAETFDTRQTRKGMFWPSEITNLQSVCGASGKAFMVDMAAGDPGDPLATRPDLWFQFGDLS